MGTSWLGNLTLVVAARFFMGIGHAIILIVTYILAVEVADPKRKAELGLSIYLVWAASLAAWGGLGFLLWEWRLLQFGGFLPGVLFLPMLWLLDESPRWLMVSGRHPEALRVLRKAARWNKVDLPPEEELFHLMKQETATKQIQAAKVSVKDRALRFLNEVLVLFKTPRLRKINLCTNINFSLSGGNLSDSPFICMALSGLMEVPAYTLSVPLVHRYGRRNPAVVTFLVYGVALLLLAVIPEDVSWAVMTLAMLGKMTNTAAFTIAYFYASELFPTEVRTRGIGTCSTMSRIGSILAPYILDFVGTSHSWAPSLVFGLAFLLAAGITRLLPETHGAALLDTVAEMQ